MVKIENFNKIHNEEFEVWNTKFIIEWAHDTDYDIGNTEEVWVHSNPDMNYVLLFHPDFRDRTMKVRRCLLGEGRDGDDLVTLAIGPEWLKTMDSFKRLIIKTTYDNFDKLN